MSDKILGKQVSLYDPYSTKDAIDEEITNILEDKEAVESNAYVNIKIVVGICICVLGYVSYFKYGEFPSGWLPSLITIIIYSVLSYIIYYIENYKEKDCFLEIVSSKVKELKKFDVTRFCSSIEDYSEYYTLAIEGVKDGETKRIELKKSVGEIFDSEGYLHKDKVMDYYKEAIKMVSGKKK